MSKQRNYFLSHSVGLPYPGMVEHFNEHYFDVWHTQNEPWPQWMAAIENFRDQVAKLINADKSEICPQSNLSSGLTKLLHSLPAPAPTKNEILCSAEDFPSMAFVLQKAEALGYRVTLIAEAANLHDLQTWQSHLSNQTALCLITHVQSNNGRQLPVGDIISLCQQHQTRTIVDVAQSVGLFAVNAKAWQADVILGSCVKWLCGGPGAGYLWVNANLLQHCEPVDVGWFSHANPFEFDIRHFEYANDALRFWGGTPTVAPYVHASYAIEKTLEAGVEQLRDINYRYLSQIHQTVSGINPNYIKSPTARELCSGTVILDYAQQQNELIARLQNANIAFDSRPLGSRLSPHFYNSQAEVDLLCECLAL